MQAHQREFRREPMCQILQVSRSGFYAWDRRPPSARAQRNQYLTERMHRLHQHTREAYGAREDWQLLNRLERPVWPASGGAATARGGDRGMRRRRFVRTVQVRQQELTPIPNRSEPAFRSGSKESGLGCRFHLCADPCGLALCCRSAGFLFPAHGRVGHESSPETHGRDRDVADGLAADAVQPQDSSIIAIKATSIELASINGS